MLAAGYTAPAFSLPDLNGTKHTLAEMLPLAPVLVVLYKISCPVCQLILPYLQRISNSRLQIVAISQDDAAATSGFVSGKWSSLNHAATACSSVSSKPMTSSILQ